MGSESIRKKKQKEQAHKDKWTERRDNGLKNREMEKETQYKKETKEWLARHGKEAQKELDAEILDFQQQLVPEEDVAAKAEKDEEDFRINQADKKAKKELEEELLDFEQQL